MEHQTPVHRISAAFADELQLAHEHIRHLTEEVDELRAEKLEIADARNAMEAQAAAFAEYIGGLEATRDALKDILDRTGKVFWPTLNDVNYGAIPDTAAYRTRLLNLTQEELDETRNLLLQYKRAVRKALGLRTNADERIIAVLRSARLA